MSSRVGRLTTERLKDLPAPCQACVFWELPKAPRGPQPGRLEEVTQAKHLWHRAVELEWGASGSLVVEQGEVVAYATYMPTEQAHRTRRLGSVPSDDALVLATIWVAPEARGRGLATALLHSVLRHAHDGGLRAVEAVGARGTAFPCMLPEEFLIASGFVVHHEHPSYPLLRLDLRQTARWQDAMEHALEGVRSVLGRRERQPVPSSP